MELRRRRRRGRRVRKEGGRRKEEKRRGDRQDWMTGWGQKVEKKVGRWD